MLQCIHISFKVALEDLWIMLKKMVQNMIIISVDSSCVQHKQSHYHFLPDHKFNWSRYLNSLQIVLLTHNQVMDSKINWKSYSSLRTNKIFIDGWRNASSMSITMNHIFDTYQIKKAPKICDLRNVTFDSAENSPRIIKAQKRLNG